MFEARSKATWHELLVPKLELIKMYIEAMSLAPLGSDTAKLNVWLAPLPEDGVTVTPDGARLTPDPTVQDPHCTQPVFNPARSRARAYTFCRPEKAA